jgi:hypothetical protein
MEITTDNQGDFFEYWHSAHFAFVREAYFCPQSIGKKKCYTVFFKDKSLTPDSRGRWEPSATNSTQPFLSKAFVKAK